MYKLRVPDHLIALVRGLHPELKWKIRGSLKNIAADPNAGKPLKDELEGLRSFRVSRFRIIYRIAVRKEIQLIAIGPRERIYEETYRLLRKDSKGRKRVDMKTTRKERTE
ncbi:MAG: type II toxin-antitoxin system RelE/ParE family toxin [Deltaproteobacteria bacterium]|nr:type II toxin-antitoxin system RelE/ParE family toxin [Deltaproteobacteria bacterium]